MFDQMKKLNEMRKNAQNLQKELEMEILEVTHKGITVKLNGNMDYLALDSAGNDDEAIVDAINEASKKMKKVVEKKMRGRLGELGLNF
ncbi:YbaB/EbfC family nucleoid-associated protein [candidate division WWE3 bacterium]|uniref:YbaB/EbfC family nucleoid-associated protein n=1 Tax=candidate division WWE3 bacterium TaxID=2053526 RepID=A0A955LG15_UNCKA|nr:YbaB/EbfC family nucleoid-associated protein [candidate division WWE3 bacterium]